MILYLHGFRSSPRSFKAQLLAARLIALGREREWMCPQLPVSPLAAVLDAERLIAGYPPDEVTLIGSSLGGFYATYLAEKLGCRAVMLNPATRPHVDLEKWLGEQPLWHGGGSVTVEHHHLDELRALDVPEITRPERYYLVAATGDEVLDYRDMLAKFAGAKTTLIEGGDHGISNFADYTAGVLAFCGIPGVLASESATQ